MKRSRDWDAIDPNEEESSSSNVQEISNRLDIEQPTQRKCPYLDTINRSILDFDSEKLCSLTLTNKNVYVCLICGKYFEGRGKHTPAYTHSVQMNHYVFMNVESGRAYCLPDSYEIHDVALKDIQKSLSPTFTLKEICDLDANTNLSRDVHGVTYLPGFVGLNNLNATDDINVILHLFSHIKPFRDFFLQPELFSLHESKLLKEFSLIMRKLWSSNNFKSMVSPQELVQTISIQSKRRFAIGIRCEVLELFSWLLMTLQKELNKHISKRSMHTNVLYEPFQGTVKVISYTKKLVNNYAEQQLLEKWQPSDGYDEENMINGWIRAETTLPYTYLSLDIPPCPLFRDSQGGLIIPQLPLYQLLTKFNGVSWMDTITKDCHVRKQFHLQTLPQYLIFHLVRFTKNNFSMEKNPTIVTFPVKNLEMKALLTCNEEGKEVNTRSIALEQYLAKTSNEWEMMGNEELEQFIVLFGSSLHQMELKQVKSQYTTSLQTLITTHNTIEIISGSEISLQKTALQSIYRSELQCIGQLVQDYMKMMSSTKYDLIANVCHDSDSHNNSSSSNKIMLGDHNTQPKHQAKKSSKVVANNTGNASGNTSGNSGNTTGDVDDVVNRGHYKIHLPFQINNNSNSEGSNNGSNGQWYELQDLHVTETTPQLIGVSESYLLVYEKKRVTMTK